MSVNGSVTSLRCQPCDALLGQSLSWKDCKPAHDKNSLHVMDALHAMMVMLVLALA